MISVGQLRAEGVHPAYELQDFRHLDLHEQSTRRILAEAFRVADTERVWA